MKKTLSLILAMLMLASAALVSCSDDQQPDDTTADTTAPVETTTEETTTIDPRTVDELPTKQDFGGYNYVVLTNLRPASSVAWAVVDVQADSENGERINDAVFKRNLELAERFNIKVVMDAKDDKPQEKAKKAITAGDESFTVISTESTDLAALALGGYLLDMKNIKYLNFDKAWWDTDAVYDMSVGNKIFFAGSSATLNTFRATWLILFNKRIVADAKIPDLYQTVRDGKWTLDLLKTYGKQVSKDVDGDGVWTYGKDIYGIGLQDEIILPLYQSVGAKGITVKKDGTFEVTIDSEKMMTTVEKVWEFMNNDSAWITNTDRRSEKDKWVQMRARFMEGQIVFFMGNASAPTQIMEAKDDFGILPFPKVNETDAYASSFQYNNYYALSVPKIVSNPDRTGMLTEAYVMSSHDTVRTAWYDYTLTLRAARDNESGEMLDIIFSARGVDVGNLYTSSTKLSTTMNNAVKASSFTFASTVAAEKEKLQTSMQKVVDSINALPD